MIIEGTVKTQVQNVLRKMEAGNRAEAVSKYLLRVRPAPSPGIDRRSRSRANEEAQRMRGATGGHRKGRSPG